MMQTEWRNSPPPRSKIGLLGLIRIVLRIVPFALVTYGGLLLLLLVRLIEAPVFGLARPVTPYITQGVCKTALLIMGIRVERRGQPMQGQGAIVANHASWLDIFVLNACDRVYFVSKAEVARWAGIGWLARATGTVFIARNPAEAKAQQVLFEDRLRAGHRLCFFPEGTSTDSLRVLPFKSTLFAAFFSGGLREQMQLQPVSLRYQPPQGAEARHYGWWAEMDFASHLLRVLAQPGRGRVRVVFHPAVAVQMLADRKAAAAVCEATVRAGFDALP